MGGYKQPPRERFVSSNGVHVDGTSKRLFAIICAFVGLLLWPTAVAAGQTNLSAQSHLLRQLEKQPLQPARNVRRHTPRPAVELSELAQMQNVVDVSARRSAGNPKALVNVSGEDRKPTAQSYMRRIFQRAKPILKTVGGALALVVSINLVVFIADCLRQGINPLAGLMLLFPYLMARMNGELL